MLGVLLVACAACSPVVIGSQDYRTAGARSAGEASAQVAAALMAGELAAADRGFMPYLAVVAGDAEDALSGIDNTFGGLQPPGPADEQVRTELSEVLSDAQDNVAQVRIALVAGRAPDPAVLSELSSIRDTLDRFAEQLR